MKNPNIILINMGKRIAMCRKTLGLSQEELAEKTDVTPQMISTAERGIKAIRPENLINLSRALGVSADYLLTGDTVDKDCLLILDKLNKLTPEKYKIVEAIIDSCVALCDDGN